jgi:hypothetical protein
MVWATLEAILPSVAETSADTSLVLVLVGTIITLPAHDGGTQPAISLTGTTSW